MPISSNIGADRPFFPGWRQGGGRWGGGFKVRGGGFQVERGGFLMI